MPVTRIKARPKKKNKPPVDLTEEELGLLFQFLSDLSFLKSVYSKPMNKIMDKLLEWR